MKKIFWLMFLLGFCSLAQAQIEAPISAYFTTEVDSALDQQNVELVIELPANFTSKLHIQVGCNTVGAGDIANQYLDFALLDPGNFSSFRQEGNLIYLGLGFQQLIPIFAEVYAEDSQGNTSTIVHTQTN